ncbi:CDKN2AIP N-terminal-like protein [Megalobrama amblycephala]|uniref:CDKN2AIP N-terminal-like protein n=1 Tax=Megalobrama amblycephala TaxID=75352 RepID=UPI0020140A9C|nr:CDKN2AIP N-terminal-like protein [Megalobrama amblycephala]
MATTDVEDFIGQNRLLADFVEKFRGLSESDKQWKYRREFLFRNISNYEEEESRVDHLLAMSMVWANHVFLGCRYNPELLERVREMADGIDVEDAPVFKTRDELIQQQQQQKR